MVVTGTVVAGAVVGGPVVTGTVVVGVAATTTEGRHSSVSCDALTAPVPNWFLL